MKTLRKRPLATIALIFVLGLVLFVVFGLSLGGQLGLFMLIFNVYALGWLYLVPALFLGGVVFLSWLVGRITGKYWHGALVFLLISGVLVGSELRGRYVLESLCRRDAGAAVHKNANEVTGVQLRWFRDTPGFCNAYCVELLGSYSHVEMVLQEVNSSYMNWPWSSKPGIYRFSLAERGSPECDGIEPPGWHLVPKGKCLAARPIQELTTRYLFDYKSKTLGLDIHSQEVDLIDTASDTTLATWKRFHQPRGTLLRRVLRLDRHWPGEQRICPKVVDRTWYTEVLRPRVRE